MPRSRFDSLSFAILTALAAGATTTHAAPVFSENFSPAAGTCDKAAGYFPAGWTRFNVDNLTPNMTVNYVTNAWIVRDDFRFDKSDCSAFSTSWYDPAGTANDFMCTPPIALPAQSILSWRAVTYDAAYRDGYEVRVMREAPSGAAGSIGNLLSSSTVVFSTPAEEVTWTQHQVTLHTSGFANENVYVCWRNNTTDKFLAVIDDVSVSPLSVDLVATKPIVPLEYTVVPAFGGYAMARGATLSNQGGLEVTNAKLSAVAIRNGIALGAGENSPIIATMPSPSMQDFAFAGAVPIDATGTWAMRYSASANESGMDSNAANDVVDSGTVVAGTDELARDDGSAVGTLGVGANNGGEIGQQFDLKVATQVSAIRYALAASAAADWPGHQIIAHLRAFDPATGKPGAIIADTTAYTSVAGAVVVDAPRANGPVALPPGRYVATVSEPTLPTPATLPLVQTATRFTPGTTWINWPTNPNGDWSNFEAFGDIYARTAEVRLVVAQDGFFGDGFEDPPARAAVARPMPTISARGGDASSSARAPKALRVAR